MLNDPKDTARTMIKNYGRARAIEYATGYASGFYYAQPEFAKTYWRAVLEAIQAKKEC